MYDYRELSNGFSIPVIGYGTFPQEETLLENMYNAYEAGYRMFDTSDNYMNEEYVGQGLSRINSDTSNCVIITKYSSPGEERQFKQIFLESQRKLGKRENIIYLLHWPYPFLWKYQWKRMEELYLNGFVKAIGVCNFEIKPLKKLLASCRIAPMINQIERHPLFQQKKIVDFCQSNNICIMSYSPVARADKDLMENETLVEIANKYRKTVGQIILRWNIETNTIPIPASSSKVHIDENINVFDFQLTTEEIGLINQLDVGKRIRYDPKKRFTLRKKASFLKSRVKLCFK